MDGSSIIISRACLVRCSAGPLTPAGLLVVCLLTPTTLYRVSGLPAGQIDLDFNGPGGDAHRFECKIWKSGQPGPLHLHQRMFRSLSETVRSDCSSSQWDTDPPPHHRP